MNRLIHETSPYLLQHAHNPVDWNPWGEEALSRARSENKPIFLSIGYSACHWCHVMERESFENDAVAAILNEHFISIKVDREERPDLDDIYMQSVQMMTGHGGWPMSVFLTPELKPFFGGTYFPPDDRQGMIGFRRLLTTLAEMYRNQPDRVAESAKEITQALREQDAAIAPGESVALSPALIEQATRELDRRYDSVYGGFGAAPKFPPSMALNLLLREHARTGDPRFLEMTEKTLTKMANGGMYDQLGGGFARYSTDHRWLVPHFEKMLYDNALLAPVYFDAALVTKNGFYERVGREILDYVIRDMSDPDGGFYSAEDADSEGEEGKFYVWTPTEIRELLGGEDAALFGEYFDVTEHGNFEGHNILNVVVPLEEFALRREREAGEVASRINAARARLWGARERRIHPFKDTKVLTAWNGMMISAMARGAQCTGEEKYQTAAANAAHFILENLRDGDGGLLRTWGRRPGQAASGAKIPGFIDDYAFMVNGLIDLYDATFGRRWLETATELAERMQRLFYDEAGGCFFTTDGRDPTVLFRKKDVYDGATPSGNSAAVHALLRLGLLLDRNDFRDAAMKTLSAMHVYLSRMPGGVHHLLCTLGFALGSPKEIAIIADPAAPETEAILKSIRRTYLPNRVMALAHPDEVGKGFNVKIALLRDKSPFGGGPVVYVCENYTCQKPAHSPEDVLKLL